jgi:hypothetical protein
MHLTNSIDYINYVINLKGLILFIFYHGWIEVEISKFLASIGNGIILQLN